jgi:DNA-binding Lrp family transcriptional regulator
MRSKQLRIARAVVRSALSLAAPGPRNIIAHVREQRTRPAKPGALASPAPSPDEGHAVDGAAGPDKPQLDRIDRIILAELQMDGRITNVELARRATISAPPCLRRVRRLEEAGIIRGYHADTDPHRLGWEIIFFAIVGLESQKESALQGFEREVGTWPEVRECHMIRGGGDFLLRLVARDTAHENRLTEQLTGLAVVSRVQTLQTIRTSRNLAGVPLGR